MPERSERNHRERRSARPDSRSRRCPAHARDDCLGGVVVGTVARGVPSSAITILLYLLGYVFLLIVGLIVVNVVLTRRTREEREAERRRRRRVP